MSDRHDTLLKRARATGLGVGLTVTSIALALLLGELIFTLAWPLDDVMPGQMREVSGRYTSDAELGYRPTFRSEFAQSPYTDQGVRFNDYPAEKRDGVQRLLFIGDSVTKRGYIIDALEDRMRGQPFEFWNAGVEGFNTAQEVAFYQRWNYQIEPDHVIITIHNNDFSPSAVVFATPNGEFFRVAPTANVAVNSTLYRVSQIYRRYVAVRTAFAPDHDPVHAAPSVRRSLGLLKNRLAAEQVRLTAVVLPVMLPPEEWTADERLPRQLTLEILEDLEIPSIDLLAPLNRAIEDGVELQQKPGDKLHPSRALARYFAEEMLRTGWPDTAASAPAAPASLGSISTPPPADPPDEQYRQMPGDRSDTAFHSQPNPEA